MLGADSEQQRQYREYFVARQDRVRRVAYLLCGECRYYQDLDVAATAEALGCSPGTVKSQTARGLASLRKLLGEAEDTAAEPSLRGTP